MFSRIANSSTSAYSNHNDGRARRTAATTRIVSQTATTAVNAYDRASIPAQVVRGRIANITPEQTATDREENCFASTTTPAAATPTARPLGTRDQNSVAGEKVNQPCMSR